MTNKKNFIEIGQLSAKLGLFEVASLYKKFFWLFFFSPLDAKLSGTLAEPTELIFGIDKLDRILRIHFR